MKSYVLFSLWLMFSYFLNEAAGVAMRHDVLDPMFLTWATLPGTIMHEGSHYIMSLLLGGHPVSFNVVPRAFYVDGELAAILQGSVLFKINEYNGAASALAPLLLVPVPAFFTWLSMKADGLLLRMVFLYFAVCAWNAFMPSSIDFELAVRESSSWSTAMFVLPFAFILNCFALYFVAARYNR